MSPSNTHAFEERRSGCVRSTLIRNQFCSPTAGPAFIIVISGVSWQHMTKCETVTLMLGLFKVFSDQQRWNSTTSVSLFPHSPFCSRFCACGDETQTSSSWKVRISMTWLTQQTREACAEKIRSSNVASPDLENNGLLRHRCAISSLHCTRKELCCSSNRALERLNSRGPLLLFLDCTSDFSAASILILGLIPLSSTEVIERSGRDVAKSVDTSKAVRKDWQGSQHRGHGMQPFRACLRSEHHLTLCIISDCFSRPIGFS